MMPASYRRAAVVPDRRFSLWMLALLFAVPVIQLIVNRAGG